MDKKKTPVKTFIQYLLGFLFSLALTDGAYLLVTNHSFQGSLLIAAVLIFAFLQLGVQLFFFLHISEEQKPRWNLTAFVGTFGGVLLVVISSIWIMYHLNYNMTPTQMDQNIVKDEGIKPMVTEKPASSSATPALKKGLPIRKK